MVYLSPMTTTTSSDFPSPSCVCAICLHEHESPATMVHGFGDELICKDEDACEQREEANEKWPQPDDAELPVDPPFDYSEPDCEEVEGGRGWYDYDDGSCEKWYD